MTDLNEPVPNEAYWAQKEVEFRQSELVRKATLWDAHVWDWALKEALTYLGGNSAFDIEMYAEGLVKIRAKSDRP